MDRVWWIKERTDAVLENRSIVDLWAGITSILNSCSDELANKLTQCIKFQDNTLGYSSRTHQRNRNSGLHEETINFWDCTIGEIWKYRITADIFISNQTCFIKPTSEIIVWPVIKTWIERVIWKEIIIDSSTSFGPTIWDN